MKTITFGRGPQNDVVINDPTVSGVHCQIEMDDDGRFLITDLNSTNGTYVNDMRISGRTALSVSDRVKIGRTWIDWYQQFKNDSTVLVDDSDSGSNYGGANRGGDNYAGSNYGGANHGGDNYAGGSYGGANHGGGNYGGGNYGGANHGGGNYGGGNYGGANHGGGNYGGGNYGGANHGGGNYGGSSYGGSSQGAGSDGMGVLIFLLGLAAAGLIAYIVISFFNSWTYKGGALLGGTSVGIKLFPIYLKGYMGFGGQWVPMIAAVALGFAADIVSGMSSVKNNKLSSVGLWLGNAGVTMGLIFILLAIFAEQITKYTFGS